VCSRFDLRTSDVDGYECEHTYDEAVDDDKYASYADDRSMHYVQD
jgi:hypothetical protein